MTSTPPSDDWRYVHINDEDRNAESQFCSNVVITSQYTALSFLPKFLLLTFRKLANFYFLVVSVMQMVPAISNTDGFPSTLPTLLFIVSVDAVFAVLEDLARHRADNEANAKTAHRLTSSGGFEDVMWRDLRVGDVVKVLNWEVMPADCLILAVSEPADAPPAGICYVETKSLDGETNLKLRQAMELTYADFQTPASLVGLTGFVKGETPNRAINKFTGTLEVEGRGTAPISPKSVMLRGCTLRNTEWIYCVVYNTGEDTKIMQNNSAPPAKWSSIEKAINRQIFYLVGALGVFCFIGATGSIVWETKNLDDEWYLSDSAGDAGAQFGQWVTMFFYYFLLSYQFIPVSLYVSMSTVKFAQAYFMQLDLNVYHEQTDTPLLVRSMGLNEELGQISYIFSDKTGTLTCNVMDFRKVSINGKSYGRGTTEIGLAAARRAGRPVDPEDLEADRQGENQAVPYVNFFDRTFNADLEDGASGREQQAAIQDFLTHLAVCHTVIPEKVEGTDEVRLSASSPDEQALVAGAQYFGYAFQGRAPGVAIVHVNGEPRNYEVLDVLEFNSTRKRMSCVVREPGGRLRLYSKGADSIMYARIDGAEELKATTMGHMEAYAADGLRTLVIGIKDLDEAEYQAWAAKYHDACADLATIETRKRGEDNDIDRLMEEMETGLTLLGATAIEDKLQKGVPTCIADLAKANIAIWVLTGDKEETAINIGFACQLLTNEMRRVVVNMTRYTDEASVRAVLNREADMAQAHLDAQAAKPVDQRENLELALVIDGEALELALEGECKNYLLRLAQYCKAVVACRVSPAQKAQMVSLIKDNIPGVRTLAIGDGANDVAMIQRAHIGIGISGQEGMQAVNSSDYAIAQFRFLTDLLLVHGRYNYRRISKLVVYMFYKNILMVLVQYWFTFYTGFSGQKFYPELGVQAFNVVYTALPILLIGVLDRDVGPDMARRTPKLFLPGPKDAFFNDTVFWGWMLAALWESVAICFVTMWSFSETDAKGASVGLWTLGTINFTLIVLVANIKTAINQYQWAWFHVAIWLLGIIAWFISGVLISNLLELDPSWYGVFGHSLSRPAFWLCMPLAIMLCSGRDLLWKAYKRSFRPEYYHLCMEVEKMGLDEELLQWRLPDPPMSIVDLRRDKSPASMHSDSGAGVEMASRPSRGISAFKAAAKKVVLANRFRNHGFAFSSDPDTTTAESLMITGRAPPERAVDLGAEVAETQDGARVAIRRASLRAGELLDESLLDEETA